MSVDVSVDSLGNDLLEEFSRAFHEADGAVCFWYAVIRFSRLVNHHNQRFRPGVSSLRQSVVKQVSEGIRSGLVSPFQKVIPDPTRSGGRFRRSRAEGKGYLLLGDRGPGLGWARWRVIQLGGVDCDGVCWEEACFEE